LLSGAGAILLLLSFLAPLLTLVIVMPGYLRFLVRRGRTVDDVHKQPIVKVPSPAGPLIFATAAVGEVMAYLTFGTLVPLAVLGATAIAFVVGFYDDVGVLGGKVKPILLLASFLPLLFALRLQPDLYDPRLYFPFLGATGHHFTIYTLLALAAFPIVANAFNMMDSFNGEISGFTALASLALTVGLVLHSLVSPNFSAARLAAALPLLAVSAGFHLFNRYPSRAFDGNSGSVVFGAMFAAVAITGGVEVAAVVAILPSILNSFYILSSLRGFVERRQIGSRPTYMAGDGMLHASEGSSAPLTLVRLVLLPGPLPEKELVKSILQLAAVACVLSILTSVLTWVRVD
jgi:UDP-N-acetylglucosamine--dolichyl-phosphate N-acetylglucosaminephosphotransferase